MKVGGMKSLTNEIIRKRVKNNQNLGKFSYGNFRGKTWMSRPNLGCDQRIGTRPQQAYIRSFSKKSGRVSFVFRTIPK